MFDNKGMRFPLGVILLCAMGYAAYPLSYRRREKMMGECVLCVEHSSINRWANRFLPVLEAAFRKRSVPQAHAGVWMKHTSRSKVAGSICTAPLTRKSNDRLPADGKAGCRSGYIFSKKPCFTIVNLKLSLRITAAINAINTEQ